MMIDKDSATLMLALTQQMLALAQCGDWDGFVQIEEHRSDLVNSFKACPDAVKWMDARIIQEILTCDDIIKPLVASRMQEINNVLNVPAMGRRMSNAYSDVADQA
jgi:hypothetical protein